LPAALLLAAGGAVHHAFRNTAKPPVAPHEIPVKYPTLTELLDRLHGAYFHGHHRQLMDPPASSRAIYDAVRRGEPVPPGVYRYPLRGNGYVGPGGGYFKARYEPPEGTLILGFRNEAGQFDVIRYEWEVAGWRFRVADSASLGSYRMCRDDLGPRTVATVKETLTELLAEDPRGNPMRGLGLKWEGDDGRVLFGRHDPAVYDDDIATHGRTRVNKVWYHDGRCVGILDVMRNPLGRRYHEPRFRRWLGRHREPGTIDYEMRPLEIPTEPSETVQAALDRLLRGEPPGLGVLRTASDPRVPAFPFLRPAFQPPAGSFFLEIVDEDFPVCTAIRIRYLADDLLVEQGHNFRSHAIWLSGVPASRSRIDTARAVAARLFDIPLELELLLSEEERDFGAVSLPDHAPFPNTARDEFRWWAGGDVVGFAYRDTDRTLQP
jgi:hypothetical protein